MTTARDPTFGKFTSDQGKAYAASRGISYPAKVFQDILDYHGGDRELVVDVGCGPGNVTRDLLKYFKHVIGVDNSKGMIDAAESFMTEEEKGRLEYKMNPAEKLHEVEGIEPGTVDLITSATAIHWFDFQAFYDSAAKILRPGGTVAAWVTASAQAASSFPNAEAINKIFEERSKALDPYKMPANIMADNNYEDLPLPWTIDPPNTSFAEASFKRIMYSEETGNSLMKSYPLQIERLEKGMQSASPYVRWKEANPQLVGTEHDLVKVQDRKLREVLGEGVEVIDMEVKMVTLLFKKTA